MRRNYGNLFDKGNLKGFCFVRFTTKEAADRAISEKSGTMFPPLRVNSPHVRVGSTRPRRFLTMGIWMAIIVVELVQPMVENVNEHETVNANFGGDLLEVMQQMISEELYGGFEQRRFIFNNGMHNIIICTCKI